MGRTIRRRLVRRIAVTAATAALAAACSAAPAAQPSRQTPPPAPAVVPVTAARVDHVLPDDPTRMLFPTAGDETRWTQGLDAFAQQIAHAAAASCARRDGFALPAELPPPAFIRLFELPDLDFVAQHGFSRSADVPMPPPGPGSATARPGDDAEIRRCQTEGGAAANTVRKPYTPLQQHWFQQLTTLRKDPATLAAFADLPACLAGQGVRAESADDFFAQVDRRVQRAATEADAGREDRTLGHAYATCMRPVEAVRVAARERLRARFLTDHATELRTLRQTLVPDLRAAEKRYGVVLSFPAP
ncbi:hypothetical protein ACF07V_34815 [Streptomyces sp. NPDC015661]|uniref:hypothetical protein n=1 Tax=Streptomyces sp. NPDC015661 TaxID=3364961 RepID=UPI0036FB3C64